MMEDKTQRRKIIIVAIVSFVVLVLLFVLLFTKYGADYLNNNDERKNETPNSQIKDQSNELDDSLKQLRVLSDRINIRKAPSVDSLDIGDVYEDDIYTILEIEEDDTYYWYKIMTKQELTGFIASNKKRPYVELIYETKKLEEAKKILLTFEDIYFENSIKNALSRSGTSQITEYDMLQIHDLTLVPGTTDISGIRYAQNLEELTINSNVVKGLDETASLPNLDTVEIGAQIQIDISFLRNLKYVIEIAYNNPTLTGGGFEDICVNKNLEELFFYNDGDFKNISFLNLCTSLEELELWHAFNETDDISVLLDLPSLKEITLNVSSELTYGQESVIKQLMKNGVRYHKA